MTRRQFTISAILLILFVVVSLTYSVSVLADLTWQNPMVVNGGPQLVLSPALVNPASVSAEQMEDARIVIKRRLASMHLTGTYQVIAEAEKLLIELPYAPNKPYLASIVSSVGEVEFINGGLANPPVGQMIRPATDADPTLPGYQTLFTGHQIETAALPDPASGQIFYKLVLQPEASAQMVNFIETQPDRYLCMVLDREVLNCSTMYHLTGDTLEILPELSSGAVVSFTDLAVFIKSGPLPVPFTVVNN